MRDLIQIMRNSDSEAKKAGKTIVIFSAVILLLIVGCMCVVSAHAVPTERHVGSGQTYATIQAAVDAANPGDTIIVRDGTYVENVNINKQLVLKSASSPIVDGNNAGPCMTIADDGVTIDGFELRNGYFGIASWGTDSSVIQNNIIHDIFNTPGYAGCGIMFWSDDDDFDNNVISNNEIYDCDRQGIYIGGETSGFISENNVIHENTIYNNGLYTYPNGPDASAYGIQLSFADNNKINNNEIYNHDDWFASPGFDFAQGIYLFDSNNNEIECNNLHDNNYGVGIWRPSRAAGTNYINYNKIAGNTGYGIRTFDGAPSVNAENNWWGSSTGPTHSTNPGGTGDMVSDNVDFDPWLIGLPTCFVPEVPLGTAVAGISMIVAFGAYFGMRKRKTTPNI